MLLITVTVLDVCVLFFFFFYDLHNLSFVSRFQSSFLAVALLCLCEARKNITLTLLSYFLESVDGWGGRRSILTRRGSDQQGNTNHAKKKEVVEIAVTFISCATPDHACVRLVSLYEEEKRQSIPTKVKNNLQGKGRAQWKRL